MKPYDSNTKFVISSSYTNKKIIKEYAKTGSVQFNFYFCDSDEYLKNVSPVIWSKSNLPDQTLDKTKEEYVSFSASKLKQFKDKVDYNSWTKVKPRTVEEKLEKLKTYAH